MVTPTPMPKERKKARSTQDDSIPFLEGSYYILATRMMDAVRQETGIANKLKGATRGATEIGLHTRRRFSALSLLGKVITAVLLVGAGAGLAAGAHRLFIRRDADSLRREARSHLARGELVEARRDLEALRLAAGDLTQGDRAALAEPLGARIDAQARKLRAEVERNARLGRRDRALAALDALDALEADQRWALFTRAELLRAASHPDAGATYERFIALYPDSDQADDALYWQALVAKEGGRTADARALCEKLLWKFPRSNFRTASDRMLGELTAGPEK